MGSQDGRIRGYCNNHGDRKTPKDGVVGPLANGRTSWPVDGGDPNYLLKWMILQVHLTFITLVVIETSPFSAMYPTARGLITK